MRKIIFLLFVLFSMRAFSWWDSPHMVITKIAEEKISPSTKEKIEDILDAMREYYPQYNDTVSISIWADDVAKTGFFNGFQWHGSNKIYDPDNILSKEKKELISYYTKHYKLLNGMERCISTLKNEKSTKMEKAIMLSYLLHLVGDAHTPLHCIDYYSKEFPNGDYGATKFVIRSNYNTIHRLWDSCLGYVTDEIKLPLNKEDLEFLEKFSNDVKETFNNEILLQDINDINPKTWVNESYQIAVENAYEGMSYNCTPSDEYIKKNRKIALQRLYVAGHRLALLLEDIFNSEN